MEKRINFYLWNSFIYIDFNEAVSKGDYTLVGRYIKVGSPEYEGIKCAVNITLTLCDEDTVLEEVGFIEGESLGM